MPVEKISLIELRCDRCRALLRERKENEAGEELEEKEYMTTNGPFVVMNSKKKLVEYKKICPHCLSHLETLVKKMSPVDRTKGGRGGGRKVRGKR